jgi:hypothetical protein
MTAAHVTGSRRPGENRREGEPAQAGPSRIQDLYGSLSIYDSDDSRPPRRERPAQRLRNPLIARLDGSEVFPKRTSTPVESCRVGSGDVKLDAGTLERLQKELDGSGSSEPYASR